MQNLRFLNEAAFVSDKSLLKEIHDTPATTKKGILPTACLTCGASLCIRKDIHYKIIVQSTDPVVVLSNITFILKVSVLATLKLKGRPDFFLSNSMHKCEELI